MNWPFEISAEMQMFLTRFILGPIDIIFKGLSGATPEGDASRRFEWSKNLLLLGEFTFRIIHLDFLLRNEQG